MTSIGSTVGGSLARSARVRGIDEAKHRPWGFGVCHALPSEGPRDARRVPRPHPSLIRCLPLSDDL